MHRIDKPTTGIFLLARNPDSVKYLKFLMKKRIIKKKYLALVTGQLEKLEFTIKAPLIKPGKQKRARISFAGKNAETYIKVLKQKNKFALVKCELLTGRTHQIRSHLKFINHPILNDNLYNNCQSDFLFLHSYKIEFNYFYKKKNFCFTTPLPFFFKKKLMSE
ncbi:MAG: RNA pseudouridine synthase [Mollicutes bacterium]|nr:MAG: RNA pseudouridine synthase [Mollicutes bacterium]